jgi:hypothetical protein
MSFVLMFAATITFAGASKQASDDGDLGEFGAGV